MTMLLVFVFSWLPLNIINLLEDLELELRALLECLELELRALLECLEFADVCWVSLQLLIIGRGFEI